FYGDFRRPSDATARTFMLPSLRSFSATGGFSSCEAGDPRVMEPITVQSELETSRYFDGQNWSQEDLSSQPGKQCGVFRIRLALQRLTDPGAPSTLQAGSSTETKTYSIISQAPLTVQGNNPLTMIPKASPLTIGALPDGSRLQFSADLKGLTTRHAF